MSAAAAAATVAAAALRVLRLSSFDLLQRPLRPDCFQGFVRLRELELAACQAEAEQLEHCKK